MVHVQANTASQHACQLATVNSQPATVNSQPATVTMQHAAVNIQQSTCNSHHATVTMQYATVNMQQPIWDVQRVVPASQHQSSSSFALARVWLGACSLVWLYEGLGGATRGPPLLQLFDPRSGNPLVLSPSLQVARA